MAELIGFEPMYARFRAWRLYHLSTTQCFGGEEGIRTPEIDGFEDRSLEPLEYFPMEDRITKNNIILSILSIYINTSNNSVRSIFENYTWINLIGCRDRNRTCDLQIMSLASYLCSTLRYRFYWWQGLEELNSFHKLRRHVF